MRATTVFRADPTNVGDWFCAPRRYFDLPGDELDILAIRPEALGGTVVVGGGGLVAETFRPFMERLAQARPRLGMLIAWGIGESLAVDRSGGFVLPHAGPLPEYLAAFDLVGLRDFGTEHRWVPCASCTLPQFDASPPPPEHDVVVYEHKRIRIPIDGLPQRTNAGQDIDAVLSFLASGEVVVTNSYHGAYWATLLGRRVVAVPNMSKMYRLKHAPVIGRPEDWRLLSTLAVPYPEALAECRAANRAFHAAVLALHAERGLAAGR